MVRWEDDFAKRLAGTRCAKMGTGLSGEPWERLMFSSRLQSADDDDDVKYSLNDLW